MSENEWQVASEVAGSLLAEMLKGLLESQGIPVMLSQEGVGHSVFAVTVGPLGKVQILVPAELVERARNVLDEYESGALAQDAEEASPQDDPSE